MANDFLVKLELNSAGIQEILKGPEVQELLLEYANKIAANCGEGYETDLYIGATRANAGVIATSKEAIDDNFDNNTLLKNMHI